MLVSGVGFGQACRGSGSRSVLRGAVGQLGAPCVEMVGASGGDPR